MTIAELDFLTEDRIFQSSDLKKDRALLDAARGGFARLRDTDGTGLVMVTEGLLKDLAEQQRREHVLVDAAISLLRVEVLHALLPEGEPLNPAMLATWTWLSEFDADDRAEFIAEMRGALIERDLPAIQDALMGWEETARALADPERRAALLSEHAADDYVEVERPEGVEASTAGSGQNALTA